MKHMSEQVSAVQSFEQNKQLKVSQASAVFLFSMFYSLTDVSNRTHVTFKITIIIIKKKKIK